MSHNTHEKVERDGDGGECGAAAVLAKVGGAAECAYQLRLCLVQRTRRQTKESSVQTENLRPEMPNKDWRKSTNSNAKCCSKYVYRHRQAGKIQKKRLAQPQKKIKWRRKYRR